MVSKANVLSTAAALSFAMGSTAEAQPNNPCPKANRLTTISPACNDFLMKTLRHSVYDDVSDTHAVLTYQKLAPGKLDNDGILGPITARSILRDEGLHPASPAPNSKRKVAYIDKSQQVMYMVRGGVLRHAFSISSGTEKKYSERGKNGEKLSGTADTPLGLYRISREEDADYKAPLGSMPYAHFYDDTRGIAIHSGHVDNNGRDSHGCVRVNNSTMKRYIVPGLKIGNRVKVVN